ncbi:MAG: hypothetical protein DYG88_11400 [Chloroflexi bacterium CFX4]|nr:hypothetical protein [Chloroflexi bacterium CFX4]MDL1922980.1 hypothetical protein [Chloroflexi bacterium CFX3]
MNSSINQRKRNPILRGIQGFLSVLGALALFYIVSGLVVDISEFDMTSGGYSYPYENWTGTPIDYTAMFTTDEGMYKRGRVIELYMNCQTGMVSWSFLGLGRVEWREFSDRAKVVHQPQVACQARGFDTSAWDALSGSN